MRYWITTHWPPREDEPANRTPFGVWVPSNKLHVIQNLAPGDLVWIYEYGSGRPEERHGPTGGKIIVRCRPGRQGVIALVKATEAPKERAGSVPTRYVNGSEIWWRYHAGTRPMNTGGFIPRREAAVLLGHEPGYSFRGYNGGAGLREIGLSAHQRLLDAYIASSHRRVFMHPAAGHPARFGPGGESAEHLALKNRIASNPAAVLREAGLRLIEKEMLFVTSDKIDVVLEDAYGRLVAVEVERDCGETETAGPLQCMKYRALLAYRFDRDPLEVRAILAAHSAHPVVRAKCARYEIEVVVVARSACA
jgi:hypothetical protein